MTVRDFKKNLNPEPLPDRKKTCVIKQCLVVSELQLFNKNTFNQFVQKELKRQKSKSNGNQFVQEELKRNKSNDNQLACWK